MEPDHGRTDVLDPETDSQATEAQSNIYAIPIFWRDAVGKRQGNVYPMREVEGDSFFPLQGIATIFLGVCWPTWNMGIGSAEIEGQREEDHMASPPLFICWSTGSVSGLGTSCESYALVSVTHC